MGYLRKECETCNSWADGTWCVRISCGLSCVEGPLPMAPGSVVPLPEGGAPNGTYAQNLMAEISRVVTANAVPPPANATQVGGEHYKKMGVQVWDVVDTWPLDQRVGYYRGNALKYLMRMGSKDQSAQEIAKGKHYMEKLLEVLNGA